mmetsp:Transcript_26084/g.41367  ORF Transcript_26084/g.41367 Transcript_26084/m.41367 type:complete len:129 (-) Transcript_26084:49-435(-)
MAQAPEEDDKFKNLTCIADLEKYIKEIDEDQNVILTFYDPNQHKDQANPMTERLQNIMDNEGIFTVTVAQVDRTRAKEDIMKRYAVNCDCIIAIDKTKKDYPAVKVLTNFMEMSIKKMVIAHKYKAKK